jgi:dolichol-phosphate mannosyltransferase
MLPLSLSIIVPCYNEELGLEPCVRGLVESLNGAIEDYEIIIVNDCSKDRTAEIADQMAALFPQVRAIHNPVNKGLGFNYQLGFKVAKKEYVILVPGDNELHPDSVKYICQFAGKADIITCYPENFHIRPRFRRIASKGFTTIINWISGYNLRYYNGNVLQKREHLLKVTPVTNSFAFQAEILVQLLRMGLSYHEVPFQLNFASSRMSAFRFKNVVNVNYTILRLIFAYRLPFPLKLRSNPQV